jgi:hypothetical protein
MTTRPNTASRPYERRQREKESGQLCRSVCSLPSGAHLTAVCMVESLCAETLCKAWNNQVQEEDCVFFHRLESGYRRLQFCSTNNLPTTHQKILAFLFLNRSLPLFLPLFLSISPLRPLPVAQPGPQSLTSCTVKSLHIQTNQTSLHLCSITEYAICIH